MTIEDILQSGVARGGRILEPHKDGLPGLGYIAQFDPSQLGRSGLELEKYNYGLPHSIREGHVDVIERLDDIRLHHRIYEPTLSG